MKISCPECRQQHIWTASWKQRFPKNFYLESGEQESNTDAMAQGKGPENQHKTTCDAHNKRITMYCESSNCKVGDFIKFLKKIVNTSSISHLILKQNSKGNPRLGSSLAP